LLTTSKHIILLPVYNVEIGSSHHGRGQAPSSPATWLAPDEINQNEKKFQIDVPNVSGVEHAFGVRPKLGATGLSGGDKQFEQD
jgi:hypothetical protein